MRHEGYLASFGFPDTTWHSQDLLLLFRENDRKRERDRNITSYTIIISVFVACSHLQGGAFERWLGHEGRRLILFFLFFFRKDIPGRPLSHSSMRTQQSTMNQESALIRQGKHWHFDLRPPIRRTVRNRPLLFAIHPLYSIFLQSPGRPWKALQKYKCNHAVKLTFGYLGKPSGCRGWFWDVREWQLRGDQDVI